MTIKDKKDFFEIFNTYYYYDYKKSEKIENSAIIAF